MAAGEKGESSVVVVPSAADEPGSQVAGSPPANRLGGMFRRPPGPIFHVLLFMQLAALVIAWSWPGVHFGIILLSMYPFVALVLVWFVRLATYAVAMARHRAEGRALRFVLAPIAGLCFLGLAYAAIPLRVRWYFSRGDFERALELAPPPTRQVRSVDFEVPTQIGSYGVTAARRQGDAVIFYDNAGSGFDDAGFAYLPTGPFPELSTGLFENPQFRSLGGHWYAWTASW